MLYRLLISCIVLSISGISLSQEIEQLAVFSGSLDYVAFGNTMNTSENGAGQPCVALTESSAEFTLEADQSVVAAYLYWAGSGPGDFDVQLNGTPITASRTFADVLDVQRIFFAAFADVTTQLQTTGNGTYTLSDLDVNDYINSDPIICNTGVNFAGWAVTVIFEDPDLPINQINVFDGLEHVVQNDELLEIELENLNVIDNEGARIGFVSWEGDAALAINETLSVNGNIISNPPLNPANNQFNSTNSFTEATDLFNMDLDFYNIENNIDIGDNSATITLTSGQDFVMINNIITVLNSTLPDAIITLNSAVPDVCLSRDIVIEFTVTNQGTEVLPAATPIAFYTDEGILVGSAMTTIPLDPDESESGVTTITIPAVVPDDFNLIAVVDDTGDGTGIVSELDETNNTSQTLPVSLNTIVIDAPLIDLFQCDDITNDGIAVFDLTINGDLAIGDQEGLTISYHLTEEDAENDINPIADPDAYANTSNPQTIYIRIELDANPDCLLIDSFDITVEPLPFIAPLDDLVVCDDISNDGMAIFDLTQQEETILGDQINVTISYHVSMEDAQLGINPIADITTFENSSNPQTIYIRLENSNATACFAWSSFQLVVEDIPVIASPLEDFIICDDPTNDDLAIFDLTINEVLAIGGQTGVTVSFHLTEEDALSGADPITNPDNYQNISNPQQIYLRIVQNGDDLCVTVDAFTLEIFDQPTVPPLDDIAFCDDTSNDGILVFDLTTQQAAILEGQESFALSYHISFDDAANGINPIEAPQNFQNTEAIQSVYVRLENPFNTSCFDIGMFTLEVLTVDQPLIIPGLLACNEGFEMAVFDLTTVADTLALAQGEIITGYYLTTQDAFEEINAITDPFAYTNSSNPQTLYIRIDNPLSDSCYALAQFEVAVENCPPFVPEGFSPNDDLFNQTFEISGLKDVFVDYELLIYSRYGNLIYEGDNETPFWDGVPNTGLGGTEAPTGTYFYVLKLNDPDFDDILGWVYLNR